MPNKFIHTIEVKKIIFWWTTAGYYTLLVPQAEGLAVYVPYGMIDHPSEGKEWLDNPPENAYVFQHIMTI